MTHCFAHIYDAALNFKPTKKMRLPNDTTPMATAKEIKKHLYHTSVKCGIIIALKEIGKIKPWVDKRFKTWIFYHRKYPVEYSGDSPGEVIKNYPLYLRDFIEERLNNNLAPPIEKATKGGMEEK